MKVLQNLEPAGVFRFFEEICSIPHVSFNEKQLSDYCVAFAKERDLYYEQDALGNVIIIGSDAHIDQAVGNHDKAESLLTEVGFPKHLIVNQDVDFLKKYVNRYKF